MGAQFCDPGDRIRFATIIGDFEATVGEDRTLMNIRLVRRAKLASAALDAWLHDRFLMLQKMSHVTIIERTE